MRGDLDVKDISLYGQNHPWDNLVAALFGYYITRIDDTDGLVYYGRKLSGSPLAKTTMSSKEEYGDEEVSLAFSARFRRVSIGNLTTLTVFVRGDSVNGYAVKYTVTHDRGIVRILAYRNGVEYLAAQSQTLFSTWELHRFGIEAKNTVGAVEIIATVDGKEYAKFVDTSENRMTGRGKIAMDFFSTNAVESQNKVQVVVRDFSLETTALVKREPEVMLRWSDDGGNTWSDERRMPIGKTGEYNTRVRWRNLGASRNRVFRFSVSDPVKIVLINSHMTVDGENV